MAFTSPIKERIRNAWDALFNRDPPNHISEDGMSSYYRPDRPRLTAGKERSIVTAVLNRIAMDVSAIDIKHIRLDDNGRYSEDLESGLNNCLSYSANIDQTGRAFKQDVAMSLLDEGCVAIVPIEWDSDLRNSNAKDILSMRTGKIIQWYPNYVTVRLYNENKGIKEDITLPKDSVAIVENPLFSVMNEPNSTLQRLSRKLALLDTVDEQSSAGKLDLIIQLPYVIKSEARKQQADLRRAEIEKQLAGTKYGIAYTDGTEKITQLNRPIENNLMKQVEYLTTMLYTQLGMTPEILSGSADEKILNNYFNRTLEPIISAITDEMRRKFLTKTAIAQKQTIAFFRDPFKLVPVNEIATIADTFTRNEIMSSNEIRQIIGLKPSSDPEADVLRNKNLNAPYEEYPQEQYYEEEYPQEQEPTYQEDPYGTV